MWPEAYLNKYMTRCADDVTNRALSGRPLAESCDGIQIHETEA
jgi:hypothetical protein